MKPHSLTCVCACTALHCSPLTAQAKGTGPDTSVLPSDAALMTVTDFRKFPGNKPNPGQTAGVLIGDVLESVDGKSASTPIGLIKLMQDAPTGSTIELSIWRHKDAAAAPPPAAAAGNSNSNSNGRAGAGAPREVRFK